MATPIYLSKSLFVGELKIDFGNFDNFNDYAAQFEKATLYDLFGYHFGNILYEYWTGEEEVSKYYYLIDGIDGGWEDSSGVQQKLSGIKEMFKYLFFDQFITEMNNELSRTQDVEQAYVQSVTGQRHAFNKRLCRVQNRAVELYNELIEYIDYQNSVNGSSYYENFVQKTLQGNNTFGILK